MTGTPCRWCDAPTQGRGDRQFCGRKCRQAAFRLRRLAEPHRRHLVQTTPARLAYADPPYPGRAKRYYGDQPTYAGEVDHPRLIEEMTTHYDGWALSTASDALADILPMCPRSVRVCAWVKPIGVSRRTWGLRSTWEPLIVSPARHLRPGKRDWLAAQPARKGGKLIGRKPLAFCAFLFAALGAQSGDTLADLFPGTGIVGRAWREWSRTDFPLFDFAEALNDG